MFIRVLLVGLLIALDSANASQSNLSLKALCKGEKVDLRTTQQLYSLVGQLDSADAECSDAIKTALKQMKVMTQIGSSDVCTMEQASAITDLVDNHLRDAADGTKRSLPKPLEKFAVAYGMRVSGICSHRMLRELPFGADLRPAKDSSNYMNEFLEYVSDKSTLGMVLDPLIKPGEIILPVDLMQAIPGLSNQIHLMIPKQMGLLRFKLICEKVFQPLYEPLILPLAHLSRAGFNNREFYWAWKYHQKSRFWSRAVFLCEIAKTIEYDQAQKVAILKDEQAAIEIKVNDLHNGLINRYESEGLPIRQVEAKPEPAGVEILGRFDFSMNSLVKAFDANKDHIQLLRERIMKRGMRLMRLMFKKKGFGKELKKALNALQVRNRSMSDIDEAKRLLLTLMESPQSDSASHLWLVKVPKYLLDATTYLLVVAITIVPLIIMSDLITSKEFRKVENKIGNFYLNYLQTSETDLEVE